MNDKRDAVNYRIAKLRDAEHVVKVVQDAAALKPNEPLRAKVSVHIYEQASNNSREMVSFHASDEVLALLRREADQIVRGCRAKLLEAVQALAEELE